MAHLEIWLLWEGNERCRVGGDLQCYSCCAQPIHEGSCVLNAGSRLDGSKHGLAGILRGRLQAVNDGLRVVQQDLYQRAHQFFPVFRLICLLCICATHICQTGSRYWTITTAGLLYISMTTMLAIRLLYRECSVPRLQTKVSIQPQNGGQRRYHQRGDLEPINISCHSPEGTTWSKQWEGHTNGL